MVWWSFVGGNDGTGWCHCVTSRLLTLQSLQLPPVYEAVTRSKSFEESSENQQLINERATMVETFLREGLDSDDLQLVHWMFQVSVVTPQSSVGAVHACHHWCLLPVCPTPQHFNSPFLFADNRTRPNVKTFAVRLAL